MLFGATWSVAICHGGHRRVTQPPTLPALPRGLVAPTPQASLPGPVPWPWALSASQTSLHTRAGTRCALSPCCSDVNKSGSLFPFTAVPGNRLSIAATAAVARPAVWWQNWDLLAHPQVLVRSWGAACLAEAQGARPFRGRGAAVTVHGQLSGPLEAQGSGS